MGDLVLRGCTGSQREVSKVVSGVFIRTQIVHKSHPFRLQPFSQAPRVETLLLPRAKGPGVEKYGGGSLRKSLYDLLHRERGGVVRDRGLD